MTTFSTDDILTLDPSLWSTAFVLLAEHKMIRDKMGKMREIRDIGELGKVATWYANRDDSVKLTHETRRYVASDAACCHDFDLDHDLLGRVSVALRSIVGDDPLCEALASGYTVNGASSILKRDSGNTWRKVRTIRKKLGRNDSESAAV